MSGDRNSPDVVCWTTDHWVAGSYPLGDMFHHKVYYWTLIVT